LVLALGAWPMAASDAAGAIRVVTSADDGQLVQLRRGEALRLVLSDTAGTGYGWQIEHNDARLLAPAGQSTHQLRARAMAPGAEQQSLGLVVGGPLEVSFLFRAVGVGSGELRLRHWRPWEGPRSIDRRFKLSVRVVS
jgi:predicted secreted protein